MTEQQEAAMRQALEQPDHSEQHLEMVEQPEHPAVDPCKDGSCTCCWTHLDEQPAQQEPVAFLANGTRFKMSFFENEDGPGTHVTCFEAFEKELDGRWVALVAAEDDCHRNLARPQAREALKDEMDRYAAQIESYTLRSMFISGWVHAEAAHGIKGEK